uniref:cysteine-rich with EGF-like domain protein 2 isoform X2 n=1 Tax=Myxine glutinosa TaxID=7769 RepID=UPI00358FB6AD
MWPLPLLAWLLPRMGAVQTQQCSTCSDLASGFQQGLIRTAKKNFGGGNTEWEERRPMPYERSETRLVEIMDNVCQKFDDACLSLLEASEDHLERWWFHHQHSHPDLNHWLCEKTLALCCNGKDCPKKPMKQKMKTKEHHPGKWKWTSHVRNLMPFSAPKGPAFWVVIFGGLASVAFMLWSGHRGAAILTAGLAVLLAYGMHSQQ